MSLPLPLCVRLTIDDLPEVCVRKISIRVTEDYAIEDVEILHLDLDLHMLANWEIFRESHVLVQARGAAQECIVRFLITRNPEARIGESGGVEDGRARIHVVVVEIDVVAHDIRPVEAVAQRVAGRADRTQRSAALVGEKRAELPPAKSLSDPIPAVQDRLARPDG